jgi:hypothetical protein
MIRNWKTWGLSFLVTLAVAAMAHAGDEGVEKKADPIKEVNKKIDTLSEQIKNEFATIKGAFDKIGVDMKDLKDANFDLTLKLQNALDRIKALEKDLAQLKGEHKKVRDAFFSGPGGEKAAGVGRLVLSNLYMEDMLFIINGKAHRIAPGETMPIETFPAGPVTYEIVSPTWGLRARRTTTLAAGEKMTLTAQ